MKTLLAIGYVFAKIVVQICIVVGLGVLLLFAALLGGAARAGTNN